MARSVLIVDDDPRVLTSLGRNLGDERTEVRTAEDGEGALALLSDWAAGVVLADLKMPGMSGLDLLRLLRRRMPDVDVLLMTAYDDLPAVAEAMREGAVDFLVKPLDLHQLRRTLDRLFEDRAAREAARRDERPPSMSDRLVGRGPRMVEIFKLVGQVAATRTTVVIRGESGTGKELIAREIHAASPFAAEPFVAVDCTALPSTLLESELFGHVRGAFTGATVDRRGRFALAGRGTVFLDEIGDTAPEFQSKLLRVLQEHEFYPVGAERAERTEARVIAATHRDLEQLVATGGFRQDLYYRLRVVELRLPPLRERMSDFPLLAKHLLAKAAEASGRARPVLATETIQKLIRHGWPGNVRELENCLTRAVVTATGDVIRPEHVELGPPLAEDGPGLMTLDESERAHIARVLKATRGHKSRAAEILAISRPRLNRLIEKHALSRDGLDRPEGDSVAERERSIGPDSDRP